MKSFFAKIKTDKGIYEIDHKNDRNQFFVDGSFLNAPLAKYCDTVEQCLSQIANHEKQVAELYS